MRKSISIGLAGLLASCVAAPGMAAPPTATKLQAQLKDVDAKLANAHSKNEALQAQVTQLEQQNAAKQQQMQQRDARIAALQKQLQVAGVPPSATTTGH